MSFSLKEDLFLFFKEYVEKEWLPFRALYPFNDIIKRYYIVCIESQSTCFYGTALSHTYSHLGGCNNS